MSATSPGFVARWNNTTLQPLTGNLVKNFDLNPVNSIGPGVSGWNKNGSTGLPGVSSTNISSQLGNSSGGNSLATGVKATDLTVQLVNATSSLPIAYAAYEMYIKLNNLTYIYNGSTDSNGYASIILGYQGNYTLLGEMFYYYGKPVSLNITGNTSIVMDMYPRAVESLNITLLNAYNYTSGGNLSIPENYLNITNYKQGLYRMPSVVQLPGVGTVFNYTLPRGNYSFTYSNVNYVTHSFWANVSNSYNATSQYIKPYLVVVNSNTKASFTYTLSGTTATGVPVSANTSNYRQYYAAEPNIPYSFTATLGGNIIYSKTLSLTPSYPVASIYVNITSSSYVASVGNTSYAQNGTDYKETVPYLINSAAGYIYSAVVNYTMGSNGALYIGGVYQNIIPSGGTFNFTKYYDYLGGRTTFTTVSDYTGFTSWYNALPSIQSSSMTVYFYHASSAFVKSSGGI